VTTAPSHEAKADVMPVPPLPPRRRSKPPERETLYTFGHLPEEIPACWLAQFAPGVSCEGRMQKAHLIRGQTIRREVSRSKLVLWAPAVWRPACYRHHTMLDQSKTLQIPRSAIPVETELWAAEHGLEWWLAETYGERVA
jgi:hypothetical protein